jgi:hypothetical protein
MKLKTSEVEGEVLDRLVAQCEGQVYHGPAWTKYSTDWAQAGPIIEREHLKIVYFASSREWNVSKLRYGGLCEPYNMKAPTPLVAAMRCYVASKLGDEVEVPNEIVS